MTDLSKYPSDERFKVVRIEKSVDGCPMAIIECTNVNLNKDEDQAATRTYIQSIKPQARTDGVLKFMLEKG
jgi:hypothetical protein